MTWNFENHTVATNQIDLLDAVIPYTDDRTFIEKSVHAIIDNLKKNNNYNYWSNEQLEIDSQIYKMFGLNNEDVVEIENWYYRHYPKLTKAIELESKKENNSF